MKCITMLQCYKYPDIQDTTNRIPSLSVFLPGKFTGTNDVQKKTKNVRK